MSKFLLIRGKSGLSDGGVKKIGCKICNCGGLDELVRTAEIEMVVLMRERYLVVRKSGFEGKALYYQIEGMYLVVARLQLQSSIFSNGLRVRSLVCESYL